MEVDIYDYVGNVDLLRRKVAGEDTTEEEKELGIGEKTKGDDKGGTKEKKVKQDCGDNVKEPEEKKEEEKDKELKLDGEVDVYIKPKEYDLVKQQLMPPYNENVLLKGEAGCGKTEMAKALAQDLGLDFYSDSAINDEYKLIGYQDANGVYHETPFYQAFTKGGLYLLDEIDASNSNVLTTINTALANGFMTFPSKGQVQKNPNFKCIATANTFGEGASMNYVGRNQLDGATLDRFVFISVDYDRRVENKLCKDKELLDFLIDFRKASIMSGIFTICGYRAEKRMYLARHSESKVDTNTALQIYVVKSLCGEDLTKIYGSMKANVDNEFYEGLRALCR